MEQKKKPTCRPEKLSLQFKRRIVREVKKKTLSSSKILKSLVDAPCHTKTIRRHLNNEKIKHKKKIHSLRFTMKCKEKRLEYIYQYQTISAKNGEGCFLGRKEIQFIQSRWLSEVLAGKKIFQKRITQQGIVKEDLLWSGGGLQENLYNNYSPSSYG